MLIFPQNFLEQILLELRKQDILGSIKGARGGYKLAKKLKDVIIILETDVLSDICKTDNSTLKLFWEDMRASILNVFDMPLSELKNYQKTANQALNDSI